MKKSFLTTLITLSSILVSGVALAHPAVLPHPHPHEIEDHNSLMVIGGLVVLSCCLFVYSRKRKTIKGKK